MIALILTSLFAAAPQDAPIVIGGAPYEKLETRAETEARMRDLVAPSPATWGEWFALSPFAFAGSDQNDLARPLPPEAELAQMGAGGPGPDLAAEYEGKAGHTARWQSIGDDIVGRMQDLHFHEEEELQDLLSVYLYTRIDATADARIEVTCGSDDGMRLWLNAELLVDVDVPRGLDSQAHRLTLDLRAGANHLFVKVGEGNGDFAFQLNTKKTLPSAVDAHLNYQLDLDFPPSPERAHYRAMTYPLPEDLALEVGGLDFLADGTPIVATRRGDLWRVENAWDDPPLDARFELYASGLHEPLGIATRQDADGEGVYVVQRAELTRMVDEDGDGKADLYESFCDDWGVSGNYHEFAFGPEIDDAGDLWVTLNVGFCGALGKSTVPYRGWALKVDRDGVMTPICDGLRSPNGIGRYSDGSMFYVDNQGDYVGTNRMSLLAPGLWHGHPASLRWRDDITDPGQRPPRQRPTIWFPYEKMGQSAADIALCDSDGAFGPFDGQLFVGDQTLASVMRVSLEQVNGHYQGAAYPFLSGLDCGVNRVAFAPDGSMLVGQTDRGWGSVGRTPFGLQRIVYTGVPAFELLEMRATEDGFELEFTQPLDPATVADASSWRMSSYTYAYHAAYGAPESDTRELEVTASLVGDRVVRLAVPERRAGYVHELHAEGVRSADGAPLLHADAYYTLEEIPGRAPVVVADAKLPRVLFLTHSAGFAHDVVTRPDPYVLSHAEERLIEAAAGRFEVIASEDCGLLAAESLDTFDAVVFFTTGELPIPAGGSDALVEWVRNGGAFVGVHSATDTLYESAAYHEMLGAVFVSHPWVGEVGVVVEDTAHPATAHLGERFSIDDEIYQFSGFERDEVDVLLSLDPDSVDLSLGARSDDDYALAWCRAWGAGRVFYTALGHRPEVWNDARFMEHLLGGLGWALGD